MRVRHHAGDAAADAALRTLATRVEVADTLFAKGRGLMLRRLPENGALVFPFEDAKQRTVHTLLVPAPIDVVWTVEEEVVRVETMRAWADLARATADRLVEVPAGAADGVAAGDRLVVEKQE